MQWMSMEKLTCDEVWRFSCAREMYRGRTFSPLDLMSVTFLKSSWSQNVFFLFKRVPHQGPEQRESRLTVLCLLIIIILVILLYIILLLIMENHPCRNQKWNSPRSWSQCCKTFLKLVIDASTKKLERLCLASIFGVVFISIPQEKYNHTDRGHSCTSYSNRTKPGGSKEAFMM